MCGLEKPETEFAFRSLATGERQDHCRACHAAYRRQHYLRNRAAYVAREAARIKAFRIENRVKMFDYLSVHPCVDCGETDVLVLEFDHRDPATKRWDIATIAARKPWKFVLVEIAKCDVRCANCHRRRTAAQFDWGKLRAALPASAEASPLLEVAAADPLATCTTRTCRSCDESKPLEMFSVKNRKTGRRATICRTCVAARSREHYYRNKPRYLERNRNGKDGKKRYRRRKQTRLLEFLTGKVCVDCGETDPVLLEFDHRDGVEKEDAVSRLVASGNWPAVEAEIAKCDIRCANCHRRRTAKQFGWTKLTLQRAATARADASDSSLAESPSVYRSTIWQVAGVL